MKDRFELQAMLEEILGSRNVFFQPPENLKMSYPAIVYSRARIRNTHADNEVYRQNDCYEIIVIDKNPDSVITRKISRLPRCSFDRHFVTENLGHDVFTLTT